MHLAPLLLFAAAFWGQTPACGTPTIAEAQLPPPVVGLADVLGCSITVDPPVERVAVAEFAPTT